MCPHRNISLVFCGPLGLMNAEPHLLTEINDLGASPSGGSHNSWGARCVEKLFFSHKQETWYYCWNESGIDENSCAHQFFQAPESIPVSHMQAD